MLLFTLTRWLMVEAAEKHQLEPLQLSFKSAQRERDELWQTLHTSDLCHITRVLLPRLLERIASHPIIIRPGRHFPRPQDKYKSKKNRKRSKLRKRVT